MKSMRTSLPSCFYCARGARSRLRCSRCDRLLCSQRCYRQHVKCSHQGETVSSWAALLSIPIAIWAVVFVVGVIAIAAALQSKPAPGPAHSSPAVARLQQKEKTPDLKATFSAAAKVQAERDRADRNAKASADREAAALVTGAQVAATRAEEESRRQEARAQEEKEAREKAERETKAKTERQAKTEEEADQLDRDMTLFEITKAEYRAARRLKFARSLYTDSLREEGDGKAEVARQLAANARLVYREIIKLYPETPGAEDAQTLLDGETPPKRPMPAVPELPAGVIAYDGVLPNAPTSVAIETPKVPKSPLLQSTIPDLVGQAAAGRSSSSQPPFGQQPNNARAVAAASQRMRLDQAAAAQWQQIVYVHGYTRASGAYVQAHFRAAPGMGRGRR